MKALVITDGLLSIEERPEPTPGSTEVLVAVRAAGLNAADLLQRRGFYPAPPGVPADIPGLELAGEVMALGDEVTRWKIGDRVMAIVGGGAQAEFAIVDEDHLLAVPDSISDVEAGGFAEAFSTAYDAIVTQGGLRAGDRLLVTGAAGGVGTAAVQLGRSMGAHVVASVRNSDRHDEVALLGAHEVVLPSDVTSCGPFDVVLELIGASSLSEGVMGALNTGARVVVIGVGGGSRLDLDLLGLMGSRATIGGSTLRARNRLEKANVADEVRRHALPLLSEGEVRIPILETFSLDQAEAAYERFAAGGKLGKIVLIP